MLGDNEFILTWPLSKPSSVIDIENTYNIQWCIEFLDKEPASIAWYRESLSTELNLAGYLFSNPVILVNYLTRHKILTNLVNFQSTLVM